jgi:16S rRNA (cytidine1402-2'-O)-methyltransferase
MDTPSAAQGTLYVTGTPIGNLEDITFRAVRVLSGVSLILAEDTRRTGRLLRHHSIDTPLKSYHDFNKEKVTRGILKDLISGLSIALVCDSGTPGISDPAYYLVRRAWESGVRVTAVPGPSSISSAFSISGLPSDRFVFEGFLPAGDTARKRRIAELKGEKRSIVFFESPKRVPSLLAELKAVFEEAEVALFRELTKMHEEVIRGSISTVLAHLENRVLRGEVVIIVKPASVSGCRSADQLTQREMNALRKRFRYLTESEGVTKREALARLRDETGFARNSLYDLLMKK